VAPASPEPVWAHQNRKLNGHFGRDDKNKVEIARLLANDADKFGHF